MPTSPPLTAYMTWANWGRHGTAIYVHRLQALYCIDGGLHGNPYDIPLLVSYPWSIVRLRGDDSIITVTLKTLSTWFHIACGSSACNTCGTTIITHHLIVRGFISRNSVAVRKALRLSGMREAVETEKDGSVSLVIRVQAKRLNGKSRPRWEHKPEFLQENYFLCSTMSTSDLGPSELKDWMFELITDGTRNC